MELRTKNIKPEDEAIESRPNIDESELTTVEEISLPPPDALSIDRGDVVDPEEFGIPPADENRLCVTEEVKNNLIHHKSLEMLVETERSDEMSVTAVYFANAPSSSSSSSSLAEPSDPAWQG